MTASGTAPRCARMASRTSASHRSPFRVGTTTETPSVRSRGDELMVERVQFLGNDAATETRSNQRRGGLRLSAPLLGRRQYRSNCRTECHNVIDGHDDAASSL